MKNLEHYYVIDRLCREEGLNPTHAEVEAELDRQAKNYNVSADTLRKYYGDNLERLAGDLRSNKLTRFLLENNPYARPVVEEAKAEVKEEAKEEKAEEKKPAKKPAAKKAAPKAEEKAEEAKPAEGGEEGK